MNNFKAVIFDMDGVLIDSEMYWPMVEKKWLKSKGIDLTDELHAQSMGRSETEWVREVKEQFNLSGSVEEMFNERKLLTEELYLSEVRPLPKVENFLDKIKHFDFKKAIASSSALERIKRTVDRFGWHDHFDHLISAEGQNFKGKPTPDLYLHTAKILTVQPAKCVVFEDSMSGIRAAKSAGMACVAVFDRRWSKLNSCEADLVIEGFGDKNLLKYLHL